MSTTFLVIIYLILYFILGSLKESLIIIISRLGFVRDRIQSILVSTILIS